MPSNSHYVCVRCRNVHKQTSVCEHCGAPMRNMGPKFHAPRKTNDSQWKKIEVMIEAADEGHYFGIHVSRPVGRYFVIDQSTPTTFAEAKQRLREKRRKPQPVVPHLSVSGKYYR